MLMHSAYRCMRIFPFDNNSRFFFCFIVMFHLPKDLFKSSSFFVSGEYVANSKDIDSIGCSENYGRCEM